ncbi:MAG: saccharopine dehydrogenase NADP-binding domain-containing protein [Actinomycetota bacterium]|nr:saccharopine dehydrogenase NADP-binding domain-containing protein [Actinomycetota bacterium]
MSGRIIVWGATGYTGGLVARQLAEHDVPDVVLAGRNGRRLDALAAELPGDQTVAVADSDRPATLSALVSGDDVVIATVGPFSRHGWPAAQVCAEAGCAYLDSTGEPPFIRRVSAALAPVAAERGAVLAPAFGYDFVPGQLAAVHALRRAPSATSVRVGYFTAGSGAGRWTSGGTAASIASIVTEPSFAWRRGRLVTERAAARVHSFPAAGGELVGISVGGAEHLFLPRSFPHLRDVDVYLGWAGRRSRLVQAGSAATSFLTRLPGTTAAADRVTSRFVRGSTGGPSAQDRAKVLTRVIAHAVADDGAVLARCELRGPNPYDLTASLLQLAARRLRDGTAKPAPGVLGPAELLGVEAFLALGAEVGLHQVD